jgi:hypothetical protein
MSGFYEDLKAIKVHQIASGCPQNLFLIKSPKKYFRNFRVDISQLYVQCSTGFLLSLLSKKLEHIFFRNFFDFFLKSYFQVCIEIWEKRHCNPSNYNKVYFKTIWPYFENKPLFKPKIVSLLDR